VDINRKATYKEREMGSQRAATRSIVKREGTAIKVTADFFPTFFP
jgi:hypothetical protein